MKKIKVTYFQDSGHGWIAVKRSLLKEIGALSHISSFSYQKGETVYLEEDSDANKFFKLYFASKGMDYISSVQMSDYFDVKSVHSERSAIRNYASFNPNKIEVFTIGMKIRLYGKEYKVTNVLNFDKTEIFVQSLISGMVYKLKPSQLNSCVEILPTPLENALTE